MHIYIYLMSIRSIKAAGKGTESQERLKEEKRGVSGLKTGDLKLETKDGDGGHH